MKTFQNQNHFDLNQIDTLDRTSSTLLIPSSLLYEFEKKKTQTRKDIALYLRLLLRRYRALTHSGLIPKPLNVKTEYQDKDLDLVRVGFRPFNSDWLELGELALAFGKSRCWIFIFLLKLDIVGMYKLLLKSKMSFVVPTLSNLILQSCWTLQRVGQTFARSYYVKV